MSQYIELVPSAFKGMWYFHLVSGNHRILTVSEAYANKSNAKRGAKKAYPGLTIKEGKRRK